MTNQKSGREPEMAGARKGSRGEEARLAGDRAVLHMVELLDDPDPIVRERAAVALGEMGDDRAFEALVALARGSDADGAGRAALALRNFTSPGFFEPLRALLEEIERPWNIVQALAAADRKRAVRYFHLALSGENIRLRQLAVHALAKYDDGDLVPLFIRLLHERKSHVHLDVLNRLGDLGDPRCVPEVIAYMERKKGNHVGSAAGCLGRIGDRRAITPLINLVVSDHHAAMLGAAALRAIDDPRAVTQLLDAVRNQHLKFHARRNAIHALGIIGRPEAVKPLLKIYKDSQTGANLRGTILYALGKIGGDDAENFLEKAVNDRGAETRIFAVEGLIGAGSPRALELLLEMTDDPEAQIREKVARAFAEFSPASTHDKEKLEEVLVESLSSENQLVRQYAAQALSRVDTEKAAFILAALIDDSNQGVRRAVIECWIRQPSPERIERLAQIARHDVSAIRIAALDALRLTKARQASDVIIEALDDPDVGVRSHAIRQADLMRLTDAIPVLIRRLADPAQAEGYRPVSEMAAGCLANLRTPDAMAAVEAWRKRTPNTSQASPDDLDLRSLS